MERRRVLIVEDDVLVRTVIADVAAGAGFDPICAPSLEDGIRVSVGTDAESEALLAALKEYLTHA